MVEYTVTYLEMTARPGYPRPHQPLGHTAALLHAEKPPLWYFLDLYRAVGAQYDWTDRLSDSEEDLRAFVQHPDMALYTLIIQGWSAGFFMLDCREAGLCDLAYLGLVPERLGQGYGKYLLQEAVHMGWDIPGVKKLTVNTCTLDHPRALALYQSAGFSPVRQEQMTRN
ncbi:MAG: GNAT family N-acetyltransferase [Rhodobacteraceae bacterium]|nr:GNAT family N-acetyltransferase [Paracoccaceae bacterium]